MGQCLKICEGTFCLKMVDSTAISGQIFLILMLDQFSQRRKMRLELAHSIKFSAKLYELFFAGERRSPTIISGRRRFS